MKKKTGPRVSTRRRARSGRHRPPSRHLLLVAGALVWILVAQAVAAAADPPTLYLVFRADHTFFAYLPNGTPVGTTGGSPSVIAAGTYKLILDDSSGADMEFDLTGPGVKLTTNMSHTEQSSAAYFETFLPSSTYTFRDDNNPSVVWTFSTSAEIIPSSPATTTTCSSCTRPGASAPGDVVGSAISRYRGALAATVSPAGRLALTYEGKNVGRLRAGRYTITVVDRSSSLDFTLQGLRQRAETLTGAVLVGKRSRTITLTAGRWMFFSSGGKKSYFIVVGA